MCIKNCEARSLLRWISGTMATTRLVTPLIKINHAPSRCVPQMMPLVFIAAELGINLKRTQRSELMESRAAIAYLLKAERRYVSFHTTLPEAQKPRKAIRRKRTFWFTQLLVPHILGVTTGARRLGNVGDSQLRQSGNRGKESMPNCGRAKLSPSPHSPESRPRIRSTTSLFPSSKSEALTFRVCTHATNWNRR